MKNPFVKENHTALWIAAAVGGAVAAGVSYWYYSRAKRRAEREAYQHLHAQDYLANKNKKMKKHKTDIRDLSDIIHH